MSLIICKECGKEYSDKATSCPNCGCPTEMGTTDSDLKMVNGMQVNLYDIVKVYGKNKLGSSSKLGLIAKIPLKEARKIMDSYYGEIGDIANIPLAQRAANQISQDYNKRSAEKQDEKEKLKQYKKDHTPYCPKCHSTSLTYVDKKLSIGRALVGGAIANAPGAILGGLTSKKGKVRCMNCGNTWKL